MSIKEGTHAIIQKINTDAEENGNELYEWRKALIDNEISGENSVYLFDLEKRREMLIKNNVHEYDRMSEQIISRLNREILTYQRNLTDEIFDMAVSELRNISKREFSDMFRAAVKELKGNFILYPGELSKDMLDAAEIEKAVKENIGIDIVLSDEIIPKKSGFVLRDERVEYNCLFEDLIEDKKNEQSAAVMKEVFGDSETRLTV